MSYGRSRLIPKVTIAAGANVIILNEGAADLPATVPAGDYWCHNDSSLDATYPGLYIAITTALDAAGANTYTAEVATPAISTAQTNGGIAFRAVAGASFEFYHTDPAFTFPHELIGEMDNSVITAADTSSIVDGADKVLTSNYCREGEWLTWNIYSWRGPVDQRSRHTHETYSSDSNPKYAYEYDWSEDADGMKVRRFIVPEVPGAHLYASRALGSGYATVGELTQGDTGNALKEVFWDRARFLEGSGIASDFLVVYNDVSDLQVDSHDYDICRMNSAAQRASFEELLPEVRLNGEIYTVDLDLFISTKNYDH